MSNTEGFRLAKVRAEDVRQTAKFKARTAFESDRDPGAQRRYDRAITAADRAYFESVTSAAEKFGIDPQSYQRALVRMGGA